MAARQVKNKYKDMKQLKFAKKVFQGCRLSQEDLSFDLEYSAFGLKNYIFVSLIILNLATCLIVSMFPGMLGAIIGLELVLKGKTWVQALLTSIVISIWLLSLISKPERNGLTAVAVGLLNSVILYWLLIKAKIAEPVPLFFAKAASISLSIFAVWTICVAVLYLIRFSIASLDILFRQSRKSKGLTILSVISGTIVGALIVIPLEAQIIHVSANAQVVGVLSGITFGFVLALSAWWINHCQNIPWKHPNLFRTWALKIGSHRGTSFHNLDLSGISFKGSSLGNTDLRARTLFRTCLQGTTGLERARVDSQYLDLENLKIQKLLTHACSEDQNFRGLNLQGAYLQNADMRGFDLTDTNLTGADLKGADLRGSRLIRTQLAGADLEGVDLRMNILIDANLTEANLRGTDLRDCILVRAQVARTDFTGADLTGICIEDWSLSSKTCLKDVRCDYIFRHYKDGESVDPYPVGRNFEPGEFASLFQQPENELELVFKGEFDYTALSSSFEKLQTDKPDLKLKLQGIEQRQELWVVKVVSEDPVIVESRIKEIQDAVYQRSQYGTKSLKE